MKGSIKQIVWKLFLAMFGPNLDFPSMSIWLCTQLLTWNPTVQSEIAKSFRELEQIFDNPKTNNLLIRSSG